MAGFMTKRARDRSQRSFVRCTPNEDWELWTFSNTKRAQFVRRIQRPADAPGETIVGLPVRQTVTVASWVATGDRAVVPEIVSLQLEQQGLNQRNGKSTAPDIRVLETQADKSLALATVLLPDLDPELAFESAAQFEPAGSTLPLPQDRLCIWREQGRLASVVTRGRNPIHLQILGETEIGPEMIHEIRCVLLHLEMQRLSGTLLGVVLWGDFSDQEMEQLQEALELRVSREEFPAPTYPATPSQLLPAEVELLHAKRARRRRIQRLLLAGAAVYLAAIAALVGYIAWQKFQVSQLRKQLATELPTVQAIQATADEWRKVEWAVDPKLYPVEILHQVAGLIPAQGMRLTAFEMVKGKLSIRGEASAAAAVFKLAEDIKSSPSLKLFQWQMRSPSLRPDGRAEFTIEGEPKIAKTD
jgi:hypothetical protein